MPPRPARSTPARIVLAAALVPALLPALAGCAGTPEYPILAPSAPAKVPDRVYAMRALEITVTSAVEGPVRVTGGTVFSPYFDRVDAVGIDVELGEGDEAVVTLPLGAATCPAGEGGTSAQLVLEVDGQELLQSVALDAQGIGRLNSDACALILDDE
ncbi:hypothetical protein [Demequina iriomotensis]|uniref:hypothetical protein n=1 Tax=Demequina iriomotensis TaxID=1536641 RepID=UPI0007813F24|nr:hypothetical protein [Demequina iriomotensis]